MRMPVFLAVLALMMAGCIVRQPSEQKKLRRVHGNDLTDEQVRANNEQRKKNAKTIIKNACGSMLKNSKWEETSYDGDGFFMYMTNYDVIFGKATSCPEQYVSIDLQAALYMGKHNISCSVDHDGLLKFNVPGNRGKSDAIKITCDTVMVDIAGEGDAVRIATFEENGSTYTAQLDAQGDIDGKITRVVEGLSKQELYQLKLKARDPSLIEEAKDMKLTFAGTGLMMVGLPAFIVSETISTKAILGTAAYSGKTIALASTASAAIVYVAMPVALVAVIGGLIWYKHSEDKKFKNTVLSLREIVHQALAG